MRSLYLRGHDIDWVIHTSMALRIYTDISATTTIDRLCYIIDIDSSDTAGAHSVITIIYVIRSALSIRRDRRDRLDQRVK